jgi:hypothetical protein
MADISDAERLALITHEQVRLVNSEAYLLQRTMDALHDDGFADRDNVNCHHGHSGRRQSGQQQPSFRSLLREMEKKKPRLTRSVDRGRPEAIGASTNRRV